MPRNSVRTGQDSPSYVALALAIPSLAAKKAPARLFSPPTRRPPGSLPRSGGSATRRRRTSVAAHPYASVGDLSKAGLSAAQIDNVKPMATVGSAPATVPAASAQQPPPRLRLRPPRRVRQAGIRARTTSRIAWRRPGCVGKASDTKV